MTSWYVILSILCSTQSEVSLRTRVTLRPSQRFFSGCIYPASRPRLSRRLSERALCAAMFQFPQVASERTPQFLDSRQTRLDTGRYDFKSFTDPVSDINFTLTSVRSSGLSNTSIPGAKSVVIVPNAFPGRSFNISTVSPSHENVSRSRSFDFLVLCQRFVLM